MNRRKKQIAIKRDPAESLTLWIALNNVTRNQVKNNDEFYALASLAAELEEYFSFTAADAKDAEAEDAEGVSVPPLHRERSLFLYEGP